MAMVALAALVATAGSVGAHPPADQPAGHGGVAEGSAMSLMMNYQARLLDPSTGDPKPDGSYTMSFSIYNLSSGGAALWTETKYVEVKGGLFATVLGDVQPLPVSIFNGQNLWLGIKVGADPEASPRQQLLPMPYAIYAENAGAVDGMDSSEFGDITAVAAGTGLSGGGTSGAVTLSADTTYVQRRVAGTCASGNAIRVINADGTVTCEADDDTAYAAGTGLSLWGTTFSVNFGGSGSATTVARSDHGHSAGDITSGMLANDRFSAYGDLSAEGYLDNDADSDLLTRSQADARYVHEAQFWSITSDMIVDGDVRSNDLADGAALTEILDNVSSVKARFRL